MTITAFNQLLFRARQRLREEYQRLSDGVPVLLWLRRRRTRCQAFGHRLQRTISRASSRLNESADKLASAGALSLCVVLLPLAPLGTAPSPEAVAASLEPGPRAGAAGSARPGQDRDPASTVSGRIDRSIDPSSARSGVTSSEVAAGAEPPRDENPGPKPPAPEASPPGEAGADPPPAPASAPPADLSPPATPTLPEDPAPENAPAAVGGQGSADVEVAPDPEEQAHELVASVEPLVGDPTQSIDTDLIDP